MGVLWYGGTIYTMRKEYEEIESVFTKNGKIVDVGPVKNLRDKYKDEIDKEQDLDGKTMFPGFVDSHLHIVGHGEKILHLDLSVMNSAEEVLNALSSRAKQLGDGEWLIGEGWNENQWAQPRIISKEELDEICPNNPMMLTRICRHAALANTAAMQVNEINEQSIDPQGGKIVRTKEGKLSGYFLDTEQELIKQGIPEVTEDYLIKAIQTSIDDLLQYGLVGGHSEDLNYYGGFTKTLHAFEKAIDGDKRKFRAHLLVHHEVQVDMENEGFGYGAGAEFVNLGAIKVFADGALGGRTAWLSEPYADDSDNVGLAIHSTSDLERLIWKAHSKGIPVAVHAIGDQAVWHVAKAIEKYPLTNGLRDRIIHAQIINQQVLELLKTLDIVLDIQPSFVASDFPWVKNRIGESRMEFAYPWKTFLDNQIACAAGSDAPIEQVNPLLGIEAAVLRKSTIDGKIYNNNEQLSVFEAVSLYTKGSAYVICHEHDRGQIAPNFVADFTILDKDLFTIDKDMISKVNVEMTVVDGTIVYQRSKN